MFCPSAPREVSVLPELALGHLRYSLTGVPPQSNSPPATVPGAGRGPEIGRAHVCPPRRSSDLPRWFSVLPELALGHLRYSLTGVPPQSNSPPATVPGAGRGP